MSDDRITTVLAGDLKLEHVYQVVQALGAAGQLLGWRTGEYSSGLAYRELKLGPAANPQLIEALLDTPVDVLDAFTPRKEVKHWAQ